MYRIVWAVLLEPVNEAPAAAVVRTLPPAGRLMPKHSGDWAQLQRAAKQPVSKQSVSLQNCSQTFGQHFDGVPPLFYGRLTYFIMSQSQRLTEETIS